MEIYTTEEQQVEAIKKWWKDNGNFVIVGVIVGLVAVFGWRFYQDGQISAKETASDGYQALQTTIDAKGYEAAPELQAFIDGNKGNNYSLMAALQLAKLSVDNDKLAEAEAQFSYVIANAKADNPLYPVAVMRLARLQLSQQELDAAITTLESNKLDAAFTAAVEELKGDVYVAQGVVEKARVAYQAAVDAGGFEVNEQLQSKINQLAVIEAAE
ncbi:YfgM family protein [Corallincola platygyrae]|uniref:Ancillary SecYEG translocon subunit n=1 Tax=Corallincola platygyrae TaxID=1193278 RepID=A0ABW4XIH5_9GAMM